MHGDDIQQGAMLSYLTPEPRVPADHAGQRQELWLLRARGSVARMESHTAYGTEHGTTARQCDGSTHDLTCGLHRQSDETLAGGRNLWLVQDRRLVAQEAVSRLGASWLDVCLGCGGPPSGPHEKPAGRDNVNSRATCVAKSRRGNGSPPKGQLERTREVPRSGGIALPIK